MTEKNKKKYTRFALFSELRKYYATDEAAVSAFNKVRSFGIHTTGDIKQYLDKNPYDNICGMKRHSKLHVVMNRIAGVEPDRDFVYAVVTVDVFSEPHVERVLGYCEQDARLRYDIATEFQNNVRAVVLIGIEGGDIDGED